MDPQSMIDDARSRVRVLLIEDSADDEALALRALRGCGMPLSVRVARSGTHAWRLLGFDDAETGEVGRLPDLVISDLKLPGLDGREILCLVRGSASLEGLPYVVFSSSAEDEDVRRCMESGADAYVQKPVDYEAYLTCVRQTARWSIDGFPPGERPPCVLAAAESRGGRRGTVSA